jgi:serine/threonine-protein kinase
MDAVRWQRILRLYHEVLARPVDQRDAFLIARCQGDTALRWQVESLLARERNPAEVLPASGGEASAEPLTAGRDTPIDGLQPGARLGTYSIERLLGRGGMGAVFLARDTSLHRRVALKVLESPLDGGPARARLVHEARNAAALNHPNICTVYEVGEADGCAFIAMEYIEGVPLSAQLGQSVLPIEAALRHGIEAADALAYAHNHGVIHRDLKAANALIATSGRLKLVDFGLARREDALLADATTLPSLAPAGVAVGTPYAMAPEQVRGGVTDVRTDVWALGVLLYEMVSGAKPFAAATLPELFSSILRDAPRPLPAVVLPTLQLVIERCLEKAPDDRYQSADAVGAALEAIQTGTTPAWTTWRARVRRRRWLTIAAAGLAVVTLAAGANLEGVRDRLIGRLASAPPIRLAVLPFENLTGDPEQEYFSDGLTEEMITQLGRLQPQRLSVIARTSSMRYKKRGAPIDQIGRELGVDYVLEGSARREASRVRISATLIHAGSQTQQWADSFDAELTGILALQGEVARGVARSLAITLLPAEQLRLANTRPVNPEVYEAYLKGHFHTLKETPADLDLALKYFEAALQKDPAYAPAYAGIAFVWTGRNQMGYVPPSEATPQVKAAAMRAVQLDPSLAPAHYALALAAWNEWDWETNERELRRTIDLDPNFTEVRAGYSHLLIALKRSDEAVMEAERSVRLDPLNAFNQALYGTVLYFVRRYDEAIAQLSGRR